MGSRSESNQVTLKGLMKGLGVALLSLVLAVFTPVFLGSRGIEQAQAAPSSTPVEEFWETDNTVYGVFPSGDLIYLGGEFHYVGPHTGGGVPIDAASGIPTNPYPEVNGIVYTALPDGSGGWFVG